MAYGPMKQKKKTEYWDKKDSETAGDTAKPPEHVDEEPKLKKKGKKLAMVRSKLGC